MKPVAVEPESLTDEQRERAQGNLHRFTILNALSFEILAGQILILFARQVGASLAEIGLLSALLPFAAIIQLGVAPLVNRFGPRNVMLAGWTARTVVGAGLFVVPVAAQRGPEAGTQALLVIMSGFYLCRALGMSSWLPIIQELVPPQDRGQFLSRQEWLRQLSIVVVAVGTAVYLLGADDLDRFLHVIAVGVIAAAWSLLFLHRVPNVGSMSEPLDREYFRRALAPAADRLFVRYLFFSCALRLVITAYPPFLVVFFRDALHLSPSGVIAINTVGSLGAIATVGGWGRWSDRVGARPVLGLCILGLIGSLALWPLATGGPLWQWVGVPSIALIHGIFLGGLTVSMSKFELGFIPLHGRAHYVALNVASVGVTSGIATFAAGNLLQSLARVQVQAPGFVLDRYRVFFLIAAALLVLPLLVRRTLPEARARSLRILLHGALRRRARHLRQSISRLGRRVK